MTSLSNQMLDIFIHNAEEKLALLLELRERRSGNFHSIVSCETKMRKVKGIFYSFLKTATCSCGHTTKFKVLSTMPHEFECPRRKERK